MPASVFGPSAAVTMLNRAFNDLSPGNAVFLDQVKNATPDVNAFAKLFGQSYDSLTNAALSAKVLANMGLLPNTDLQIALSDYFGQNQASRGIVVLQISQLLTNLEGATGALSIYSAPAAAWNAEVTAGFNYSSNPANINPGNGGSPEDKLIADVAVAEAAATAAHAASVAAKTAADATAKTVTDTAAAKIAADTKAAATDAVALKVTSDAALATKAAADASVVAATAAKAAADTNVVTTQAALLAAINATPVVQANVDAASIAVNNAVALQAARATDLAAKTTVATTATTASTAASAATAAAVADDAAAAAAATAATAAKTADTSAQASLVAAKTADSVAADLFKTKAALTQNVADDARAAAAVLLAGPVPVVPIPTPAFVLTPGLDKGTADNFFASQTVFNVDGKGPTLNAGDDLTGTAGKTDNSLTITDLTAGAQFNNIPAGVKLTNIQNIVLNTSGNTAAGTGFSTVGYADVRTLTATSNGGSTDTYAGANGVNGTSITATHNGLGSGAVTGGGVTVVGGTNVTVTSSQASNTGAILVGQANNGVGTNATGAVIVNHVGSGSVTSYAGTTQTITAGGGNVTVGDINGVAPKVSGAISIVDTGQIARGDIGGGGVNNTVLAFGGTDVSVVTNVGAVQVGSNTLPAVNATGNITVTDTVSTVAAIASATNAAIGAGAQGTAAYAAQFRGTFAGAVVQSAVVAYGGVNQTLSTSGSVVSARATGDVTVTNKDVVGSTVTVASGKAVTVNTSGTGAVTIGTNNAATNPTGAVVVNDTGSNGTVSVKGGSSVTVVAKGAVTVGDPTAALSTTGAVSVTQGQLSGATVGVDGGSTVNVQTVRGNVTVGNNVKATGDVTITDTVVGPTTDAFTVKKATGAVTINATGTTGNVVIGEAATLDGTGVALATGSSNPTGAVVVNNSSAGNRTDGTPTIKYGTGTAAINVKGSTSVSVTGAEGGTTVTDVQSTVATGTAGSITAGSPIGTSTLTSVTLNNAGTASVTSNVLSSVTLKNGSFGGTTVTVNNSTAAHALAVNLENNDPSGAGHTDTVVDNKAGVVTVSTAGATGVSLVLQSTSATKAVFTNAVSVAANIAGSAGITAVDASGSAGGVAVTLASGQTFTGGSGKSTVTVSADPTVAISGGSNTADEYIANYGFVANSNVSGFEVLRATIAGPNVGSGFKTLKVTNGAGVMFTAVSANTALTLSNNNATVGYTLGSDGANDAVTVNIGSGGKTYTVNAATTASTNMVGVTKPSGLETATVVSTGSGAANVLTFNDLTLKTLNVSGSQAATIAAGSAAQVRTVSFGGLAAAGDTVSVTINGTTYVSAVLAAGDTPTIIANALVTAIGAPAGITAYAQNGNVVVQNLVASVVTAGGGFGVGSTITEAVGLTASGLDTINASAATGAVNVAGALLAIAGASITGGGGALTASGGVAVTSVNTIKTGAGGGTITLGQGGQTTYTGGGTPVVAYASGSESIDLTASVGKKDTIKTADRAYGKVTGFQVTTSKSTSDAMTFVGAATQALLANVNISTSLVATVVPGLNYTSAAGIIKLLPTGVNTLANYTLTDIVSALSLVLVTAGANKVAAFEFQGNTYVLQTTASATTVDLTQLTGVTGITGFASGSANVGASQYAAQNTIVANTVAAGPVVNLANAANAVVASSSAVATTTDAIGFAVQNVAGTGGGAVQTIINLASAGTVVDTSTGTSKLNVSQIGAAGGNSLVYDSGAAHAAELTLNGAGSITLAANGGTLTVNSLVDGGTTPTMTTIFVTGTSPVVLGGINDAALKTIDASANTGGLTLTHGAANQTIIVPTAANSTVVANGNGMTITQGGGAAGAVTLTANGFGNTITLNDSNHGLITVNGGNDKITVGSGVFTLSATGSGDTITIDPNGNGFGAATVTIGQGANITLSGAGGSDTITLTAASTAGATTAGTYAKTLITNIDGSDTINFGTALATSAFFNTSGITSETAAIDAAVNSVLFGGAPGAASGKFVWFQFGGNTYMVDVLDANHADTGLAASDIVIQLTGLVTLNTITGLGQVTVTVPGI